MTEIGVSLNALDARLVQLAEGATELDVDGSADSVLLGLGYVDVQGSLTDLGHDYYLACHVRDDAAATAEALATILSRDAVVTAFCGLLWGSGEIPVPGALSLIRRLTHVPDHQSAKRWLEIMNRARLIVYNRKQPTIRVTFNPGELVSPAEDAARELNKGHVVSPETPYGNLLALRELLRAARGYLYWYEQHMGPKVLEVLYRETAKGTVSSIKLLSGPANIDSDTKSDFKRFAREMKSRRDVDCEWQVLPKKAAQLRHDRFLFSEGIRRNLPPLNLILQGSTGEILPSDVTIEDFGEWWDAGSPVSSYAPPEA